jgi:hypothetical protein
MRQLRRAAVALVVAIAGVVAAPGPADAAVYGPADIYTFARWAGFSRDQATTMTAIALAESGGNSNAHNSSGEDSRGLWQINLDAHGSWAGTMNLFDPVQNAQAAFRVSENGRNMSPWTVTHGGTNARYLRFRSAALLGAAAHGGPPTLGVWSGSPGYATRVAPGAPDPVLRAGYWMVDAGGGVYDFGDAFTALPSVGAVSVATRANGSGVWMLEPGGRVVTQGNAANFGSVPPGALAPFEVPASISVRPDGDGYWVFTDRGRALAFGAAQHFGDMTAFPPLNGPVIASATTPSGRGYWMVGSDGGIFSFGDAQFSGSMGGIRLNQPVVGIAADPDRAGYWLIAADGGIFAFDAGFRGSLASIRLNRPVIGALAYGDGYLMVGADGGIFAFSSRPFLGSLGSTPPASPITALAVFEL